MDANANYGNIFYIGFTSPMPRGSYLLFWAGSPRPAGQLPGLSAFFLVFGKKRFCLDKSAEILIIFANNSDGNVLLDLANLPGPSVGIPR
jgi:hypothetical protein